MRIMDQRPMVKLKEIGAALTTQHTETLGRWLRVIRG